jgi:gliding motility-associated-like protein
MDADICFADASASADHVRWDFGDFADKTYNSSLLRSPCHAYKDTGVYCIKQVVLTNHGCSDSITKCLTVLPEFLAFVPNAFTPNNDVHNEYFAPKIAGAIASDYEFLIYDRWGNRVYKTNTIGEGWNGIVEGGEKAAIQDVYLWRIIVYDLLNKKHELRGRLTLIR